MRNRVSGVILTLAVVLILLDMSLREGAVTTRVTRASPDPPVGWVPSGVYPFTDLTLLDVPRQGLGRMIFVEPRPGDFVVLWKDGRRGGCYVSLEVGGTVVLSPSPLCGREGKR